VDISLNEEETPGQLAVLDHDGYLEGGDFVLFTDKNRLTENVPALLLYLAGYMDWHLRFQCLYFFC